MKVELVSYDEAWPKEFEREQAHLLSLVRPWLHGTIEHVGSTSVPGMSAKPIIDIMVGVRSLNESIDAIETLRTHGYCYYPYKPEYMHWFCKPSPEFRTHHIHLIPFKSALWYERVKFRDILRTNDTIAKQYAQLKHSLALENCQDREAYTRKKWPFIEKVLGY
ncbi:GrpB family protein [Pseudoalteromonas luteoviolacea]|uniref:Glutamate-rich protein GrpB n=1 Tax=Pseudoalteromonas luteoviolacea S4054 TaxID=1129367 RepID=A0A0F6A9M2_9GAMM|nr:GrpB family protein [Pseudoalteromonas luteoviolacea]AOT10829.1 hypothetical protein S4054249_23565 [Pseudoalteromonas luteoviolacea]AOT16008.1 hypothetical protein S40542_24945 [Pseudoalteromonas luteoviolacea]AOT20651.1 hypothetical protein S4054_23485 [Pseudoalteromonas luteoviolacea]KKE82875.1 hypothetical protein N479_16515 [Pseudoalteromonas luteoviolacea S4054]KZN75244.1 hypothetical protein N481_07970 [Pseudoalteromonas luteoviolacea S4047-1]